MTAAVRTLAFVSCCVAVAACGTTVNLNEDLVDYRDEVIELQGDLLARPQDLSALGDLGVIYVRTGHAREGKERLLQAYEFGDRNPRSLLYLGFAHEALGEDQEALALYETYAAVPRLSPYRGLMEGRYTWIVREVARNEMRLRLQEEQDLADLEVSPGIVAVFPMAYQGSNPQYEPLGRGLAEMISVDLQQVSTLRVVERVRLQALRDELALGASGYVDAATAPRMGRLLQAGRVVSGTYNILDNDLRLDASVVESSTASISELASQTDNLARFFALEKRIVFDLLTELGVQLTADERASIEVVPTQNLQAFLAFSRGLVAEDAQDYGAAALLYQQAFQLDPSFSQSSVGNDRATNSRGNAGPPGNAMSGARRLDPFRGPQINILDHRSRQLGNGIQASLLPGADNRKPATEQAAGASGTFGGLPPPPPPPSGGG
ncbi:MAG: TolB-like protein [Rhodothermales bacterium]|jgi:TolB-like protein